MGADESLVVIALPVAWGGDVIEGSVISHCIDCERAVWLSPSTQRLVGEVEHTIVCIPCGEIRQQTDPDPRTLGVTLEQRAEIERHYRRN